MCVLVVLRALVVGIAILHTTRVAAIIVAVPAAVPAVMLSLLLLGVIGFNVAA